jgi:hypothetical protein
MRASVDTDPSKSMRATCGSVKMNTTSPVSFFAAPTF